MAHEYIDKHGNIWSDAGSAGSYQCVHEESPEARKAAGAEIAAFAKARADAAAAFDAEFLKP
jgi:hypothetical protein